MSWRARSPTATARCSRTSFPGSASRWIARRSTTTPSSAKRATRAAAIAMAKVGITCGGVWWPPEYFQAVEELGFDSIWTGEHIVFHRPILDAVPVLAGIAAVTNRISVGPAAILTPLRNPTMLAKELATLDIMSGGRLIVVAGVGGDFEKEFEAAGVPMAGRGRRTSETIEIMRKYWTEDSFSYAGTVFELDDVWLTPKPVQPGGPPIWLAGRSAACDRARRRARGRVHAVHVHSRALSLGVRGGAREGGRTRGRAQPALRRVRFRLREHARLSRAGPGARDPRSLLAVRQGLHARGSTSTASTARRTRVSPSSASSSMWASSTLHSE